MARVLVVIRSLLVGGTVAPARGVIVGAVVGLVAALLAPGAPVASFVAMPVLLGAYVGVATALRRLSDLEGVSRRLFPGAARRRDLDKILDTSAISDGRIADVCETRFVDGTLVVPRFVLRELQQIADSPDGLKRGRGRRGVEVLQRAERGPELRVEIAGLDVGQAPDVDQKLIELARTRWGKIVTSDYNLDKLAELRGVSVLNVNELANVLKPVVLPGETTTVQALRGGKEPGTMVVIDRGKRDLGQSLDVVVTGVLQTPAGRMIFVRRREDAGSARNHDG